MKNTFNIYTLYFKEIQNSDADNRDLSVITKTSFKFSGPTSQKNGINE